MISHPVYLCSLVLLLVSGQVSAAGDAETGATKVQTCAVCHGPDGNSPNAIWPSLAGQHASYTLKQLQDFKNGDRHNDQMTPMAMPLSEQDMEDIAAFYAAQHIKEAAIPASFERQHIELGERIYRAGDAKKGLAACMSCHGPGGEGNPAAGYPRLNGQHAAYTAAQLQAFKTESRHNDPNEVMRDIATRLTNEEIEAVSQYIQGLH